MDPIKPSDVVNNVPNVRAIRIGENVFIEKTDEGATDDLQQEVRDLVD